MRNCLEVSPIAHDVFISYSRADARQAMLIRSVLEENGISCWIDDRDIPPGTDYTRQIPQGMDQAKIFLLMLSARSQRSEWVERELKYAASRGMFIIPYMLEDVALENHFKFLISSANYLQGWKNPEEARRRLVEQIRRQTAAGEERPPVTEPPFWEKHKEKAPADPKKRIRILMIGTAVAAAAVVLLLLGGAIREKTQLRRALTQAEEFARTGDYAAALDTLGQILPEYPENGELLAAFEGYQTAQRNQEKTFALTEAEALLSAGDAAGALGVLAPWAGEDGAVQELYDRCAGVYSRQTVDAARELTGQARYSEALVVLRDGLKLLPEDADMLSAFTALEEENPVPIADSSVEEQHHPDDATTVVRCEGWDPETERDINMNTWSGGLRVCVGDLLSSTFSFVQTEITSRVAWKFSPSDHTETTFTGYIVLGDDMYGSKTYGTIRILADGQEVFSTGRVDGSSAGEYPFRVDITGVDTLIFEAEVKLVDGVFEYGIVS